MCEYKYLDAKPSEGLLNDLISCAHRITQDDDVPCYVKRLSATRSEDECRLRTFPTAAKPLQSYV